MPPNVVTLTFDEPKYIRDQNRVKFPSVVFEIWCSQGFWNTETKALTHGRTDPIIEGTVSNGGGSTKT